MTFVIDVGSDVALAQNTEKTYTVTIVSQEATCIKLEWDYEGIGNWQLVTSNPTGLTSGELQSGKHFYINAGTMLPKARITDANGNQATDYLTLYIYNPYDTFTTIDIVEKVSNMLIGDTATDDVPTATAQIYIQMASAWLKVIALGDISLLSTEQKEEIANNKTLEYLFNYLADKVSQNINIKFSLDGVSVDKETRIRMLRDAAKLHFEKADLLSVQYLKTAYHYVKVKPDDMEWMRRWTI